MKRILNLYHRLPIPMRSVAASAYGLYLHAWRFGEETERLVAEACSRETWSAEQWKTWQEERQASLLHRAATQVPYYREQWATRRRQGDRASWECLENWPVLEKEALRAFPRVFIADDCDLRRLLCGHTSGTTGAPLTLWQSREAFRALYALSSARTRGWYGVSPHDRWAMLGGQLVAPAHQRRPPFWVWNAAFRQLYMSSYHLAPDLIAFYLDALVKYRITYLLGYSSSLHALAREVLHQGRQDLKMKVVITNAEPVFDYQREAISRAFQCPVCETYGMSEMAAEASACEAGRLHLWPEVGKIEVLEGHQPVTHGKVGDLVCTGLLNADMPLIRYRVGDRGALPVLETSCACGRTLPTLACIEGRQDDVLYTPDGRQVGRLDTVFKADLPIREAQVVQEALDRIRIRYVPEPGFTPAAGQWLVEGMQARMGPVQVILEPAAVIPRTANGKFRAVICNLPAAQRPGRGTGNQGGVPYDRPNHD